ncbi:hypothetical protein [Tahibacter amnicola]|uniref:Uncharacterized protein n=1 Tax=Tahibacter amnicola TaxID=2976241 RepID=A0ABY6BIB5_9GAMM|nr:hypothetical protein [Tahibacter amnicola]UXI68110.1 hypothetical protein N4264_00205 [Tahibacter amnicola]
MTDTDESTLVLLTEIPGARLKTLPENELSAAEGALRRALAFLAALGCDYFRADETVPRLIQEKSSAEWQAMLDILHTVGAVDQARALAQARHIAGVTNADSHSRRAARVAAMSESTLDTFRAYAFDAMADFEAVLMAHVRRNSAAFGDWSTVSALLQNASGPAELMPGYRRAHEWNAGGRTVLFLDYDVEGRMAWQVQGERDGSVLVACEFDRCDHWWRPRTAHLPTEAVAVRKHADRCSVQLAYRVTSREQLDQLWSRTSHHDGIARACAPADADPVALLNATAMHFHPSSADAFAHRFGWLYWQEYGGGADEHTAIFLARTSELAEYVYSQARELAISKTPWITVVRR